MSAESSFQSAVYAALTGDAPLMAAINGVYDVAPQATDSGDPAAYPYITIGEILFGKDDTASETGFDIVLRIHTWSRSGSLKECRDIQGLVYDVLHKGNLTITGYYLILLDRDQSDIVPDPNGAHHGVCDYRALIGKI